MSWFPNKSHDRFSPAMIGVIPEEFHVLFYPNTGSHWYTSHIHGYSTQSEFHVFFPTDVTILLFFYILMTVRWSNDRLISPLTLWLFNIAMENHQFEWENPLQMAISYVDKLPEGISHQIP